MKTEVIYAIILIATVLTAIIIGCILVNRSEKREAKKETTKNMRRWSEK